MRPAYSSHDATTLSNAMKRATMGRTMMRAKLFYLAKRNPGCAAKDWPKLWRSHARFVGRFPSVGGSLDWLNYCARVLDRPVPGATTDYDGAAVIAGASHDAMTPRLSPEDHVLLLDDERRVFSTVVEDFMFRARETLVHGGDTGEFAVLRFIARAPGVTSEDFRRRWHGPHAARSIAAADAGAVKRYVQNDLTETPPPGFAFDAISETWFDTLDDAVAGFAVGAPAEGEHDPARSVTLLSHPIYRWPRV